MRYCRKALRACYLMGQNQVSTSFYIGVAAKVFGFLFLLVGLCVQMLDTRVFGWLRQDLEVTAIAVGGSRSIEFVAATFIWVYRTTISQLKVYCRRPAMVHSALLAMVVAVRTATDGDETMRLIISRLLTRPDERFVPSLPESALGERAIEKALGLPG